METTIKAPINITPSAIAELKNVLNTNTDTDKKYLRIGVKGGGCSGMSYVLGLDVIEEDDQQYDIEGIPAIMKKSHALYLDGITIDYSNGLNNRGFVFNNPNASTTCGCGSSFAV